MKTLIAFVLFQLWSSLLPTALAQDNKEPISVASNFKNLPLKVYYFDDTTNVLYHDGREGSIHVSDNEGKTFRPAEGIDKGQAVALVEHPFDNRVAFVLGKDKTHWRTKDRGKSWQSFKTEDPVDFGAVPLLGFHYEEKYAGHVIYQGLRCVNKLFLRICSSHTYYTTDLFDSSPKLLIDDARKCIFAHSDKEFKHDAPQDLIFCIAFDQQTSHGEYTLESARIVQSTDFFKSDTKIVSLPGLGEKKSRGVLALAVTGRFLVAALRDLDATPTSASNMHLFVTSDADTWAQAKFPHASSSSLRENAYTLLTGTTHSLAVDVLLQSHSAIGTLFVSNSNGTFFVESLANTNRNRDGFVDFEAVYGLEGVAISGVVANPEEVGSHGAAKVLKSVITFDDGSSWDKIPCPSESSGGSDCGLHFHSVTNPHNFGRVFSSPAPGYIIGVGSAGSQLESYEDSQTFLSNDGGLTWKKIDDGPTKYEFGGKGSVIVLVGDSEYVDGIRYSLDGGNSWKDHKFADNLSVRAKALMTLPDSTSGKFLLIASRKPSDRKTQGDHVSIFLDFADVWPRQCDESSGSEDFEKWYARTGKSECVMGHRQSYRRRKATANCGVGHKFEDPKSVEEDCPCTDHDYECDYNFVRSGTECTPAGPIPVEGNQCSKGEPGEKFEGSSGYRKIPGNTCAGGVKKDDPVQRECKDAKPKEGEVVHRIHDFPSRVVQNAFFPQSTVALVRLDDNSVWITMNEGYAWKRIHEEQTFLAFYIHPFADERAYLITASRKIFYTKDKGENWHDMMAPSDPSVFGLQALQFHPLQSDWLIWTGTAGTCTASAGAEHCAADAHYTTNNGGGWKLFDEYVKNCQWARDKELRIDDKLIVCESYRDKKGDQRLFNANTFGGIPNPVRLVEGSPYYANNRVVFENVVGFTRFAEYLLVAEYIPQRNALELQVSLDGKQFAPGLFPPAMRPDNHAYTILESSTDSVFLHLTTSETMNAKWGNIMKSNSNGTYYGISIPNVSRDNEGYVDFEKMIGLEGIAMVNIVRNTEEATVTRKKELQTRITHNDGGSWGSLNPPAKDSRGRPFECSETRCALHIHGFTERYDARATFSSPAIPGVMMGVGNVGETLAPYRDSDTFLSRDGGITWQEIRKDAHLWEFGDSGSILVLANDEEATDKVFFSTDEGDTWREYVFGRTLRIRSVRNMPSDTSRKFILYGHPPNSERTWSAVHLDFTALTNRRCILNPDDPNNDDFELWSPADGRTEKCLFGRTVEYHRRKRDSDCYVGDTKLKESTKINNCECNAIDFECNFNHIRNSDGKCVLDEGVEALPTDTSWEQCNGGASVWYERTAYRKIPHSSCEGGEMLDRGAEHPCPGLKSKGFWFWLLMALIVIALTALFSMWWRRSPYARGVIRLPERSDGQLPRPSFEDSGVLATIASIPWFIVGLAGVAWSQISPLVDRLPFRRRSGARGGYRTVAVDEDAQVLRFEDEE